MFLYSSYLPAGSQRLVTLGVMTIALTLSACSSVPSPYRVDNELIGTVEAPSETRETDPRVVADPVLYSANGNLKATLSDRFKARVVKSEQYRQIKHFDVYYNRKNEVIGYLSKSVAGSNLRVWNHDCSQWCRRSATKKHLHETLTYERNEVLTDEVRDWIIPLANTEYTVRLSGSAKYSGKTDEQGVANLPISKIVRAQDVAPDKLNIVLTIDEHGGRSDVDLSQHFEQGLLWEIWSGLKDGAIAEKQTFYWQVQRKLAARRFPVGKIDGLNGPSTKAAIGLYLQLCRNGMPLSDRYLLGALSKKKRCGYYDNLPADAANSLPAEELLVLHESGMYWNGSVEKIIPKNNAFDRASPADDIEERRYQPIEIVPGEDR